MTQKTILSKINEIILQVHLHIIIRTIFYAPNFKEVEEAYWFGPVRPCVRGALHFAYIQERLEVESWYVELVWKIRGPIFFFFSVRLFIAELYPFFGIFPTFPL